MSEYRTFYLINDAVKARAIEAIKNAPDGYKVMITKPSRSLDQNALLHAICQEVAKQMQWNGIKRDYLQWKLLFVSGHFIATQDEVDLDRGLEGEIINFRESTAKMNKERFNSLLDYIHDWCAENGVRLHDEREGVEA